MPRARLEARMNLYRIKLRPRSPWRTPWQADTLSGMLCWTAARCFGDDFLDRVILEPALAGSPQFVLSDAFPGDLLPVPTSFRLLEWPVEARKTVKRARWLSPDGFKAAVGFGRGADMKDLFRVDPIFRTNHLHVTLDRSSGQSAEGALFVADDLYLNEGLSDLPGAGYMSVYVRAPEKFMLSLVDLFRLLSTTGYGAGATSGLGQFEVISNLESVPWLADDSADASNGIVVLSTFQPKASDPTDGYWEAFTKYGKVGPNLGLDNVFKRPLIMLRPGACFRCSPAPEFVGRALPMSQIVDAPTESALRGRGAEIAQLAFGLAVPCRLP
jgi:CRISPR-associated protein Csm4